MEIKTIDSRSRERVNAFIEEHWFSLKMAVGGELIDLGDAEGFFAEDCGELTGLLTYRICEDREEILSLDSLREGCGIGSALLNRAVAEAKMRSVKRITLVTTNDNLKALGFYQRRGFDMAGLRRNAVESARKLKPEIPHIGNDGIPIRHEIELEMMLEK